MKNIIKIFLLFMSFGVVAGQSSDMQGVTKGSDSVDEPRRGLIETHNAIEAESLRLSLGSDLNGFVEGKVCDFCETIKVTITPATKAYANNVEVPLKNAESRIGRFATVIYEVDTKNVSEIRW